MNGWQPVKQQTIREICPLLRQELIYKEYTRLFLKNRMFFLFYCSRFFNFKPPLMLRLA